MEASHSDKSQEPTKKCRSSVDDTASSTPSVISSHSTTSSSSISSLPSSSVTSSMKRSAAPLSSLPSEMAAHLTEWTNSTVAIINDPSLHDMITAANPPVVTSIWTYGAGFFPETSYPLADYDFHVVVSGPLSYATQVALGDYNRKFHKEKGVDVDVYYILESASRLLTDPRTVVTAEGKMDVYAVDDAWALHRAHCWAGRYSVMYGSDPQTFIAECDWKQMQSSAMALIQECIPRAAPSSNNGCGTPYGTLQMTRLICTAVTRNIVISKAAAAKWALANDDMLLYRPQIEAALRAYNKCATDVDIITIRRGIWPLLAYGRMIMGEEWQPGFAQWNGLIDNGLAWLAANPAHHVPSSDHIIVTTPSTTTPSPVSTPVVDASSPVPSLSSSTSTTSTSTSSTTSPLLQALSSLSVTAATAAAIAAVTLVSTPSSTPSTVSPPLSTSGPVTPDVVSPVP